MCRQTTAGWVTVLVNKFHGWNTAMLIYCNGDHMTHKSENIYYLALKGKVYYPNTGQIN